MMKALNRFIFSYDMPLENFQETKESFDFGTEEKTVLEEAPTELKLVLDLMTRKAAEAK